MPYGEAAVMRCPSCKGAGCEVIDSRVNTAGTVTRRRRRCQHCQVRFTTYERVEGLRVKASPTIEIAKRLRQMADDIDGPSN